MRWRQQAWWLTATVALLGCSAPEPRTGAPARGDALDALIGDAPSHRWHFDVSAHGSPAVLSVVASLDAGDELLHVDEPAGKFVTGVESRVGGRWQPAERQGEGWRLTGCEPERCRVRYRFELERAARALHRAEVAGVARGAWLSPPSAWLLRPVESSEVPFVFRVRAESELGFVSGLWPSEGVPSGYGGDASYLWRSPYSAFGRFEQRRLAQPGGELAIAIPEGSELPVGRVVAWLDRAAGTVAQTFGRFPISRVLVLVLSVPGKGIHGREMGGGGASILLHVGRDVDERAFASDWVAVHELIHLSMPLMGRDHSWLSEGLATYLEPLARARVGQLSPEDVWSGMIRGMPHGLPGPDDRGIDRTPSWGRTYWGGALFWLLADLEIRKRTEGKRSIDDGLRAVLAAGGHNGVWWGIDRYLRTCDKATGTTVLGDLYAAWAHEPVRVDLDALWRDLGVAVHGASTRLDDAAPLAAFRRAMTRAPGAGTVAPVHHR